MNIGRLPVVAAAAWLGLVCGGLVMASPAFAETTQHTKVGVLHVAPFGAGSARSTGITSVHPNAQSNTTSTSSPKPEWVSNRMPEGNDTSCRQPGFATISAALQAATTGSVIHVCAGTYQEQLAITRSVTLAASGAVTLLLPATPQPTTPNNLLTACDATGGSQPNQDVVDICGPITVAIRGVTVQGDWPADVCDDSLYGVAALGGADLKMSNSAVEDIGGNPLTDGCQGGVGIEIGLATTGTHASTGTATLTDDIVTSYQKNGITVDGASSSATISGVTVLGAGPTSATAQNGIQVSDGAAATISGSFVSGDECNNAACGIHATQATGILLFDAGTTKVMDTTVTGCDLGIYNLEDYAWSYYTPPPSFTPVLDKFSGMGLNNRYENAYFDEGKSELTTSRLTGSVYGVEGSQWTGQTTSADISASDDAISGASGDAVLVTSDRAAGDLPVAFTISASSFTGTAGGVDNTSTSVLNAKSDWWGAAKGPSVWSFGTGVSVSSDVNFFPWATNSSLTALESCSTGSSKTTTTNDVVLCAPKSGNAFLSNTGTGNVLLLGNRAGEDQLNGSATGHTWIITGTTGHNVVDGNGGSGYAQLRGDTYDRLITTANYVIATD